MRYATAADLIEQLYRGLADNTVGGIIDSLLRSDMILIDEVGFAPLDDTGTQLLFRLIAGAYERRSIGLASHWPFEDWGRSCPSRPPRLPCSIDSCTTRTSWSPAATPTACARPEPKEEPP